MSYCLNSLSPNVEFLARLTESKGELLPYPRRLSSSSALSSSASAFTENQFLPLLICIYLTSFHLYPLLGNAFHLFSSDLPSPEDDVKISCILLQFIFKLALSPLVKLNVQVAIIVTYLSYFVFIVYSILCVL